MKLQAVNCNTMGALSSVAVKKESFLAGASYWRGGNHSMKGGGVATYESPPSNETVFLRSNEMEGELLTNQVIEKAVAPPASQTFEKCGF